MKIGRIVFLVAAFSALSFLAVKTWEYFPEASFRLADDSRLPKWIALPPKLARSDVSLTMNYYTTPLPIFDDAHFILKDREGKVLARVSGKTRDLRAEHSPSAYPAYFAVTVNGVADIIEHRRMEPIFYVTDDPAVWKKLSVE